MEKLLGLALNNFPEIPTSLKDPQSERPISRLRVNLASIYHHYYLDTHGCVPPDPDPVHFEPVRFLAATEDFRFLGDGLGIGTLARRNRSSELGGAFCRMFLHDYFGITYFEHVERSLRFTSSRLNGLRIERTASGDIPDYLCAASPQSVFLAEAKGRYDSISFKNGKFKKWREQFTRVTVKDASGRERPVKGYIVATRWATEDSRPSVSSTLFAEDPVTSGEVPLSSDEVSYLGTHIISRHYARVAEKLDQPILSAALAFGSPIPTQLRIQAVRWEFRFGPLTGRRFVGGYFSPSDSQLPMRKEGERYVLGSADPFRLGGPRGTFFGLEESIFRAVVRSARFSETPLRDTSLRDIPRFEHSEPFYSAVSVLKDGSVLAPLDFFAAIDVQEY